MADSIQTLVEDLAHEIHASIAVDDPGLRLLAHSRHFEDADPARLTSLIGRRITGPLRDYFMSLGAQGWRDAHTVAPKAELGLEHTRLCVPLRSRYELLGFLWVIVSDELGAEQSAAIDLAAARLAAVLAQRLQSLVDADVETESLVRALLADDAQRRTDATRDLHDLGLFTRAEHVQAVVVRTSRAIGSDAWEPTADVIRRAFSVASSGRARENTASSVAAERSVLLLGYRALPLSIDDHALARTVLAEIGRLDPALAATVGIGIGAPQEGLADAVASYEQALIACRVGDRIGSAVTAWADHPDDALLAALVPTATARHLVPAPFLALDAVGEGILTVVEAYLDHAGNVLAVAKELNMHRTTVYYRLKRFAELTGLDLEDGRTRLSVHLWFRVGGAA